MKILQNFQLVFCSEQSGNSGMQINKKENDFVFFKMKGRNVLNEAYLLVAFMIDPIFILGPPMTGIDRETPSQILL